MLEKLKKLFSGRKSEKQTDESFTDDKRNAAESFSATKETDSNSADVLSTDGGDKTIIAENELLQEPSSVLPITVVSENAAIAEKVKPDAVNGARGKKTKPAYGDEFLRFARILGTDEISVVEECKIFQIRKIMSRLSKAIVRYGVSDGDVKKLVSNAVISGMGEIAVSPAYLNAVIKNLPAKEEVKICSVVDFPFGESSFKVKFSEVKNSVKRGVDGVIVVINAASLGKNAGELKKQLKRIGKTRAETGVAVSAEQLGKEDIKTFIKVADKTVDYTVFLFGGVTEEELAVKMKEINACRGDKPVKVMANAENVSAVSALFNLGVDGILTPFADDIAKELFSEFGIKKQKPL
ncbi:MAG: hypothetical protein IJU83_01685 [Clostridia bacterium]|nr:hypothetical protein [Clostridia bacterium]